MPTEIRAAGLASGYFIFNALAIVLAQVTPIAIEQISWRYFLIFLIMDCIYIVIVFFFYIETKGLALEHVGEAFGDAVARVEEGSEDSKKKTSDSTSAAR